MTKTERYCYDQGRIEERRRIIGLMQEWWTDITEVEAGLLRIIQGDKL